MGLSERDVESLQRVLLELHQDRDVSELRAVAPRLLLSLIPADYFCWIEMTDTGAHEPRRSVALWESEPRFTPRYTQRLAELMPEHPFSIHAVRTGDWGPHLLSDFWSPRQLQRSAIWRDVYRHVGIGRLLACGSFRGERFDALSYTRPPGARDFSERDRFVLRLVLPHFEQALRAAEAARARRDGQPHPLPELGLTKRELEVGVWLARGRTNPEIASILEMRPRTVEKHVENILAKLGVENRTAAASLIAGTAFRYSQPSPPPEGIAAHVKPARARVRTRG